MQFEKYYLDLYNLPTAQHLPNDPRPWSEIIRDSLCNTAPNQLGEEATQLDGLLTYDELKEAVKQLKLGKRPGQDEYMAIYYKKFLDDLAHPFLSAFNPLSKPGTNMNNLSEACISVIPKAGKYPNLVTNYCPISLVNVDLKIFAKMLTNRLVPIMNTLNNKRSGGFCTR